MKASEILKKIAVVPGVSGYERPVGEAIAKMIEPFVDECYFDTLGNLIAKKSGTSGEKLAYAAHMDEIGFIVTYIEDNGTIRFAPIGGINFVAAAFARATFANGTMGIITPEREVKPADYKPQSFYLDIGTSSRKETERKVKIGDTFAVASSVVKLGRNKLCGRPIDDRVGCAILIAAAEQIKNNKDDVYFVFTVQEEVGCRGARTSSFAISPDVGIALDVTGVGGKLPMRIGKGAAIKVKDSSVICDNRIVNSLCRIAEDKKIKHQLEVLTYGGTDASAMQMSGAGAAVGGISIPSENIHSTNETVDSRDVEACVALVCASAETGVEELLR